ncbi:MAG: type II toxin-antitoxin system VapC family toxin, partial [Thermoanaerobaculia bacterium]
MLFVDTNVLMYAVGRSHPLRDEARAFFEASLAEERPLATSAEVLQELMHAYVPVNRLETLGAAMKLAASTIQTVWPVEPDDVQFAHQLLESYRGLGARDLLHLASCRRR